MHLWAIVLAAGSSSRLAASGFVVPKQFMSYKGQPLFMQSLYTFSRVAAVQGIILVLPSSCKGEEGRQTMGVGEPSIHHDVNQILAATEAVSVPVHIVAGGLRRQDSVWQALQELPHECSHVLVHDAARPFFSARLAQRVVQGLEAGFSAVVPGIPVADTIKQVDAHDTVSVTLPRAQLRAVQTPQGFDTRLLLDAHKQARINNWAGTDDASLMEYAGHNVKIIEGEPSNAKITYEQDMLRLEKDKSCTLLPCTGLGYDVHRYGGSRKMILGGVPIPGDVTIVAHSDGDTVLHALIDALLACVGAGDIGTLFPDSCAEYDGIASGVLLAETLELTTRAGLVVHHVDITIVAQIPRISPFRENIAANIAKLLQIGREQVSVKATTEEHLGFTGEKKGMKVLALVTGERCIPSVD